MLNFDRCVPPRPYHLVADTLISTGPILLTSAVVSGGGADASVTFVNGTDVNGEALLVVQAPNKYSTFVSFVDGKLFDKGLFVNVTNATDYTDIDVYFGKQIN